MTDNIVYARSIDFIKSILLLATVFMLCSVNLADLSAQCDFNTSQSISLNAIGGNNSSGYTTVYLLTDQNDLIVETSLTPDFNEQSTGNYKVYAFNYQNQNNVSFDIGANVFGITADCFSLSLPYEFTVCNQEYAPCYALDTEEISFSISNVNTNVDYVTEYALTDENGVIIEISSTNTFSSKVPGFYKIYGVDRRSDTPIINFQLGQNIDNVSGECFDVSFPFLFEVCEDCTDYTVTLSDDFDICEGQTVILTVNSSDPASEFVWSTGEIGSSISVSPSSTTTYTVTGQSGDCTENDAIQVSVLPLPSIDLGVDQSICIGESITLTAATNGGSVMWSTGATGNSITVSPTSSTTYTATVIDGICASSDDIAVNVLALPIINVGTDQTICIGESITLTAATNGGAVTWNTGDTGNSITVSPNNTTTYTATVTQGDCASTDDVSVVVNALPTINLGADVSICSDESITLTASTNGGIVTWSTGATGNSIIVSPGSTTTYTATVTQGDCTSTDDVSVVVNALPTINLGADASICSGESITLTASTNGGIVTWSTGDTGNSITVSPSSTTTYAATVTQGDCTSMDEVSVTVNALPTINLGADASICSGESITLTASTNGGIVTWSTGDTGNSITVSPSSTTTYAATVSQGDCTSMDEVSVTVNALPTINLGADASICSGESITLTASTNGGIVTWNTGDTGNSITVSPNNTTTYTATVTQGDCTSMDEVSVTVNSLPTISLGADASICAGESIILSASTNGGIVTWSTGATGSSITVSPSTTTTYTATVTQGECTSTDDVSVVVNSEPTINLGADASICLGESITLTASTNGGIVTWNTGAIGNSITVSPSATTTYTAIVGQGDCSSTGEVTVTVDALPTISLEVDGSDCNSDNCYANESETVFFTISNLNTNSDYVTEYALTNDNGVIVEISLTNSFSSQSAGSYSIYGLNYKVNTSVLNLEVGQNIQSVTGECLDISEAFEILICESCDAICAGESVTLIASTNGGIVTWNTGATGNSITVNPSTSTTYTATVTQGECSVNSSIEIIVNALPTINLGPDASICVGETVTLTASTNGGTVTWNTGATGNTITVSPSATTTYTATVTQDGCTSSDDVRVVVNPLPTINLGADASICAGESITLTASTNGGIVTWSTGATGNSITVSPSATASYTATVTQGDCTSMDEVSVTVNALPTINLGADASICAGESITLTASTNGGTVTWNTGATGNSISVTPSTTTIYTATVTQGDCTSSDDVRVVVNPLPIISLGSDANICAGELITLTASTNGGTVTWSTGATGNSISVTPNTTTTYTATVSNNGCLAEESITVSVDTDCCDYLSSEEIVLSATGGNSNLTTVYLLTDENNQILDIFSSQNIGTLLEGSYKIYAVNYDTNLPNEGIVVGGNIAGVQGECLDVSEAYMFNVCEDLSIGDFVWFDSNYNGIQDEGEEGVEGVVVNLLDENGTPTGQTTTTDENGYYVFNGLEASVYQVEFELPEGNEFTIQNEDTDNEDVDSNADEDTGLSGLVDLTDGQSDFTIDAGLYAPLSLGNLVWIDTNNDGLKDSDEVPVRFVDLALWIDLNNDNVPDVATGRTATTDVNGMYLFEGLTPGDYIVQVLPSNFANGGSLMDYVTSTGDPADPDNNVNDDDNGVDLGLGIGVTSKTIELRSFDEPDTDGDQDINSNLTVDFGFFIGASLGNYVFNDVDGDGVQDLEEVGINGVTVNLYDANNPGVPIGTTVTSENPDNASMQGYYLFDGLVPGDYYVEFETPEGLLTSPPNRGISQALDSNIDDSNGPGTTATISLSEGESNLSVDAGFYPSAKVGNYIWLDGLDNADGLDLQSADDVGLNGVTVNLYNVLDPNTPFMTQVSRNGPDGNSGYYMFEGVPIGDYIIEVVKPGDFGFVVPNMGDDMMDSDIVDIFLGRTLSFTVNAGDCIEDIDIGFRPSVVPVEWLYIRGEWMKEEDVNRISWATASEVQTDYYIIERSFEGEDFEDIGEVESNGTTLTTSEYSFDDEDISRDGLYYYRLRQVDLDGSFDYSEVVVIDVRRSGDINVDVYPNPTSKYINIKINTTTSTNVQAMILDIAGKLVMNNIISEEIPIGSTEVRVPLENLAVGTYIVRVTAGESVMNHKIIVLK